MCKPGDQVELVLEPTNEVDPNAIAVFSERGVQLGYLTAERAPYIGAIIRDGREVKAVFQHRTNWGCAIRIAFDGEEPSLEGVSISAPQAAAGIEPPPDQDFWPDEEWPDE